MNIIETKLPGVLIIEPAVFEDNRGFFMESYNQNKFAEKGIQNQFVQDNHSLSAAKGVLRGLHYQANPMAQAKLVRCTRGEIFDVAVDIRKDSPTFGQWTGITLSAGNKKQLLVPKGFAHGFCTLTENVEVMYKVDAFYSPEHDKGIRWNDPDIAVDWPVDEPILSEKDQHQPFLSEADINF
ncbi:dTDP-4-dehydrorhamnose 3,5-epimerase [Virgibacillus siamensis]|uniref:dTDP-4-dehydrorhamnose 3,5-epimerase n=1 Tax=Virgibacillus siamensis TaxID=480071 RepID=UPI000987AB9B|nr:dTDP-4-dehydrorhamnose 3,5-epimerase [Virgibacillus siamensis]